MQGLGPSPLTEKQWGWFIVRGGLRQFVSVDNGSTIPSFLSDPKRHGGSITVGLNERNVVD